MNNSFGINLGLMFNFHAKAFLTVVDFSSSIHLLGMLFFSSSYICAFFRKLGRCICMSLLLHNSSSFTDCFPVFLPMTYFLV